jgi:hypothetical protein
MSNHRGALRWPHSGGWHRDGGSIYTDRLDYLQVFYCPQPCTPEMGPTEVLPGSHFLRNKATMMVHYGKIAGTVSTAGPPGTVFLTVYNIWHRRTRGSASVAADGAKFRNLLKYNYWRTSEPRRDWVTDPAFDFSKVNFDPPTSILFEQFQGGIAAARMFCWLCGARDEYDFKGGQCWPIVPTVGDGVNQMGAPPSLRSTAKIEDGR